MNRAVYTLDKRVRWIPLAGMTPAEAGVGDGTAYPLEVTLDQIAEIFYRVKDAWFYGGHVGVSTGDIEINPEATISLRAPTTAATNRTNFDGDLSRGYTTPAVSGLALVSAHNAAYLDAEYDAGSGFMARDISTREMGIWMRGESGVTLPYWDFDAGVSKVTNALSLEQDGNGAFSGATEADIFTLSIIFTPSGSVTLTNGVSAFVRFTGNVVVLMVGAGDSICASSNRYFLDMEFFIKDGVESYGVFEASTNLASLTGAGIEVPHSETSSDITKYILRLSSGDVSCKVYLYFGDYATYPFINGSDFVHEAHEWWPYAKDVPAAPVWDSATGLIL